MCMHLLQQKNGRKLAGNLNKFGIFLIALVIVDIFVKVGHVESFM